MQLNRYNFRPTMNVTMNLNVTSLMLNTIEIVNKLHMIYFCTLSGIAPGDVNNLLKSL